MLPSRSLPSVSFLAIDVATWCPTGSDMWKGSASDCPAARRRSRASNWCGPCGAVALLKRERSSGQRGERQRLAPTIAAVYLDKCVKFRRRSCDGELHAFAIWCIDDLHDTVGKSSAHGNGSRCVVERPSTKSEAIRRIDRVGQRRFRGHEGRYGPRRRHQARPCRWNRTP